MTQTLMKMLKYIRIYRNVWGLDQARSYAVELGYFIDWASIYATSFNGKIPKKDSEFLDADLLREE
ncbi:hypothetical protein [Gynuella sunshinyii]|uniref:Uncharacterized protein n=1 Tax=Gynuella sunshinyii YC6258 TaxID=1445510 RepID=A0A0C5UZZ9_9GAMM|nr:hypothetical protein [Gynuella sunshinyii]AJQ92890.1 hypothetical Protein YC6258_00840 [Gynuella sunshinyii YC6258]